MAEPENGEDQTVAQETFEVRGTSVVISRLNDREIAMIDGRAAEHYKTPDGYLLKTDVYRRPAKTLRNAIERYLEEEAEK